MEYCKTTIYNEGLKWPLPAEFSLQKENWNLNFIAKLNIYISEAQKHGFFFFIYIILIQMPSNLIILWKHKKKHLSVILPLFSELFFSCSFFFSTILNASHKYTIHFHHRWIYLKQIWQSFYLFNLLCAFPCQNYLCL